MPKWKSVTPPRMMHADNGEPIRIEIELDLRRYKDHINLKKLEALCLAEICQRQATVITTQEKVVKLLEERLYQALNRFHPLQKKGANHGK